MPAKDTQHGRWQYGFKAKWSELLLPEMKKWINEEEKEQSQHTVHKRMISLKQMRNEIECWLPGGLDLQMKRKLQWKSSKIGSGSFIEANDLLWYDPHNYKRHATRIFYSFALNWCVSKALSVAVFSTQILFFFVVLILLWKFIGFIRDIFCFEINRLKKEWK